MQGDLVVGSTITYTYRGRSVRATLTAYESERVMAVALPEDSYEIRESIALHGTQTGAVVSMTMAVEPIALWARLIAPLSVPFRGVLLGRGLRRSLLALKHVAEAHV